jgi:hypothetical protein
MTKLIATSALLLSLSTMHVSVFANTSVETQTPPCSQSSEVSES